jgi:FG-GAP-like repeat
MGIYKTSTSRDSMFETGDAGIKVREKNIFPEEPIVSIDVWNRIRSYYLKHAPDSVFTQLKPRDESCELFEVESPVSAKGFPSTTLIKIIGTEKMIYGDAGSGTFIEFGSGFKVKKMGELEQAPVHLIRRPTEDILTVMGSFSPTDAALGMLVRLPADDINPPSVMIDKLQRPVHTRNFDFDQDNIDDYVVCEFGKFTGALTLFFGSKQSGFEKIQLSTTPGAIRSEVADINADGKPDIIALFGQARERIEVYLNKGNRIFQPSVLLQFPPYYGSSGFQLVDTDKDGDLDIIYTAGDNADFYPIIKPFHGIYLFENKGKMVFRQKEFLPLPGAYNALWADFDLDGFHDLLGVSFFPDWNLERPMDCVLWKGAKTGFLNPLQISLSDMGRWIVADADDFDGDGDSDVVLGSLIMEAKPDRGYMQQWMRKKLPFVLLRNKTI